MVSGDANDHKDERFFAVTDEEKLAYVDALTPGWRETFKNEFGRKPDPEGLKRLIARETGAGSQTDSERQERLDSPETAD
jgi:hypothetical protein